MSDNAVQSQVTGHGARWQRHNSLRQTRILEAAVELLEESPAGVEIPVQQIAKRAGLAKSVVYRQFSGRDDLDRRLRSYLVDDFSATLEEKLNVDEGSLDEILTRTVRAVADWASDHPRRHEFMGKGPTHYDDAGIDAITSLKARVATRAQDIIIAIAQLLDVDYTPYQTLPFAVVTMVEGTLTHWVRDPEPVKTRAEIVDELATYAWFVLDGAARSVGLTIDPKTELVAVIRQLTGVDRSGLSV